MATGDLVIPEGFGNSVWKWTVVGRANPVSTTMGYSPGTSSVDPSAHATAICAALIVSSGPCWSNEMNSKYTFQGVECIYNDAGTMVGGSSSQPPVAGAATEANALMIGNSWLIQKKTGLVGKHFRGRFYFPYMNGDEATVDYLGNVGPSQVTQIQASFDQFLSDVVSATESIIPNLLHHQPEVGSPPVPTVITSFNASSKVATQRRRLR